MTTANQITLGRIVLVPFFVVQLLYYFRTGDELHRYLAMAAFLVAVGPGFESGKVIPEAHQLDVYPVAAALLGLTPPDNIVSDGGNLRAALRDKNRSNPAGD